MRTHILLVFVTLSLACSFGPLPTINVSDNVGKKFTVGGVEFILSPDKTSANVVATNHNDPRVKIEFIRTDHPAGVLDVSFLAKDKPITGTMVFETSAMYLVDVKIWQDGFDLASCPFLEDMSCFADRETFDFVIQK